METQIWQREISHFRGIISTFIIEGNIGDIYPVNGRYECKDIDCTLDELLGEEYHALFCNALDGFNDYMGKEGNTEYISNGVEYANRRRDDSENLNSIWRIDNGQRDSNQVRLARAIKGILQCPTKDKPAAAVVVNLASHYLISPDAMSKDDVQFFLNLYGGAQFPGTTNGRKNTLILIVDKLNDIPAWFYIGNPNVRNVSISLPSTEERYHFLKHNYSMESDESKRMSEELLKLFSELTDGMRLIEIRHVIKFLGEDFNRETIRNAIFLYKYGIKDNPWEKMADKVVGIEEVLEKRVKGQKRALEKISIVLKRAVTGLSGMQHSPENRKPRGIFFLAGPTGTGKTETVKAVTEAMFGDERSIIRFDMSEYKERNSDQKLFGAPPGYVGYDKGGQLTNAVRNNPCCVLLFDEIEKADSSIMDKFLQILEDGRMTDGQGKTVYFSETLIFFTSNAGILRNTEQGRVYTIAPGSEQTYEEKHKIVVSELEKIFTPEVLNRIGENIILFDYIDDEKTRKDILYSVIVDKINNNICKAKGILIETDESVFNWFQEICGRGDVVKMGGRGIGNQVEEYYLNKLSSFIIDNSIQRGNHLRAIHKENSKEICFEKV